MNIAVLGVGLTNFGELWSESLESLAKQACLLALEDAKLKISDIDLLIVSNKLLQQLENRAHVGPLIASTINFPGPSWHTEAACASGGVAIRQACMAINSQMAKRVMVVGVEKMTDVEVPFISRSLMSAASESETLAGATFPALYALMAQTYLTKYHLPPEVLNSPTLKNHYHASLNQNAQFQKTITHSEIESSPMVASPLRQLHCSPISDGAAAVILGNHQNHSDAISIIGSAHASDPLALADRKNLTSIQATTTSVNHALAQAQIKLQDLDLLELHDCFSIGEIFALEDMGLIIRGQAGAQIEKGYGWLGQASPVVNSSGGLKACGHPVGATGVKQIVELTTQLQHKAGARQVSQCQYGLAHNVGGTGGTVVIHIVTNRRKK